eukprot:UN04966
MQLSIFSKIYMAFFSLCVKQVCIYSIIFIMTVLYIVIFQHMSSKFLMLTTFKKDSTNEEDIVITVSSFRQVFEIITNLVLVTGCYLMCGGIITSRLPFSFFPRWLPIIGHLDRSIFRSCLYMGLILLIGSIAVQLHFNLENTLGYNMYTKLISLFKIYKHFLKVKMKLNRLHSGILFVVWRIWWVSTKQELLVLKLLILIIQILKIFKMTYQIYQNLLKSKTFESDQSMKTPASIWVQTECSSDGTCSAP